MVPASQGFPGKWPLNKRHYHHRTADHGFVDMCYIHQQWKGSVKELNISIYFFFPPITQWCSISMFCLLVEGECQILVF